ncbi:undecaprenyldiphospho-muramoylpentapeptide beta-N-acetylglucosaminyltransferase [Aliiglaciecola sp. LCG003]|uniref:undecaprenyldiphospho-muramoylpentapeptide beta-N-acetylglucosaminyltransferase n=1 Tax=Aliiglaciecola sp. LCG003 TaxID=3053655 RepID=UPI002572A546|nr:undecaprenyldiphospho-muramoylpentapeptide beta-N-acetylglucosaminyltransferase [Aliiglaciecola sp. LCG003]WJG08728.1 undecaprenyldiphospho-muramoylpentapeptide beta-N-acetylglucosaminyltransferase [Aliiglaciecola sp. LCG003]
MNKTLLVMAGGTGGHVFPGIAVAKELAARGWSIHWLGTAMRMEADIVPKAGYSISFIDVVGVRGNGLLRLLKAPFQLLRAIVQARKVIRQVKPDVVLGMGGFASGPGGIAAWMGGIPLVVHEQNAIPGLTNKVLSKIASKVLTGFDNAFAQQPTTGKFYWVGNPVREDFAKVAAKAGYKEQINVLVVGGSLGAQALNQQVPRALAEFTKISVQHQTGKGHVETVKQDYQHHIGQKFNWQVSEFIDDMAVAYNWADIVICRAGALTVAEVAMSGVTAIFVPLPYAVDDHQTMNAKALSDNKAGFLLPQSQLESGKLEELMRELLSNPDVRIATGIAARKLAKPDATKTVAEICIELGAQVA